MPFLKYTIIKKIKMKIKIIIVDLVVLANTGGWSKDKLQVIYPGASFPQNCTEDKELTEWIILHCNSGLVCVQKQAWSSFILSPSGSIGHSTLSAIIFPEDRQP